MWMIVPLIVLLLFVAIGGVVVGGIFADVLIPIVVIVAIGIGVMVSLRRSRGAGRPPADPGSAGWPPSVGSGATGGQTPPEPARPGDTLRQRQHEQ